MRITREIKIDLNFTPTLDACPSCEVEQEFGNGVAECRSCGYHAGAELSEVWSDFVLATPEAPHGWELTNTHESEGDGFYFELAIPKVLSVSEYRDLRDWVSQLGGNIDEDTFANIVFHNNTDYKAPVTFASEEAFLEFANGYISAPERWGNLYSQTIDGIEIEWNEEAGEWAVV